LRPLARSNTMDSYESGRLQHSDRSPDPYAHRDEKLKEELRKHLSMLKRQGVISEWQDRVIDAGTDWSKEIDKHLESAKIILLLISPDFLASDYCYNIEMKRAVERHDRGEACVIPVFLRQCDWKGAPFGKLQGLPTDARPITNPRWSSHDEAFTIVARGIRAAVETLRAPIETSSPSGNCYGDLFSFLKEMLHTPTPLTSERALERWLNWECPELAGQPHARRRAIQTPLIPHVEAWLAAYDLALSSRNDAPRLKTEAVSSYVEACAASLLAWGSITAAPFAAMNKEGLGSVLELVCEVHPAQSGCLFCHPSFTDNEHALGQRFLDGLDRAWALAAPSGESISQPAVLWSVRSIDESITDFLVDLDDRSASGTAFRMFWHLRRGLRLDQNVYVLAECQVDGSVRIVRDVKKMVSTIRSHHHLSSPTTLVVATDPGKAERATLGSFNEWSETKQVSTLDGLVAARSSEAETAIAFLGHLADQLEKTPWLKEGRPVRLSDVHVPPSVLKEELYRLGVAGGLSSRDGDIGDDLRPSDQELGAASSEVGSSPQAQKRPIRVRWDEEFKRPTRTAPIVVVGGPGFGKTSLLAWTARQMALDAKTQIEARTSSLDEIQWPVLTDLDTWAWQSGLPQESLGAAVLKAAGLPEDWSDRRRTTIERITKDRLKDHGVNTFLFLDALDQVGEARAAVIRSRLAALTSFAPRMIFSTRESGLRTLQPILPFPHIVCLETAGLSSEESVALAGNWLGSEEGIRLNGYLRSHSSLSLVADSPLLLTLACLVVLIRTDRAFPNTVADLYREITRHLALGSWREPSRFSLGTGDVEAFLGDLRAMAWHLFCVDPGANRFDRVTLLSAIKRAAGVRAKEANEALARLVDLGFLEPSGEQEAEPNYHFRHATFREFLAAWYLAAQINGEGWNRAEVDFLDADGYWRRAKVSELLDRNAFEASWEPLFVFSAGILKDPAELFRLLANRCADDLLRHRLSLLCRCYGTLSPDKESALIEVMEPVFKTIRSIGFLSLNHRPHRWRGWLADVGSLITLPIAGQRIVTILTEMAGPGNERHMLHFEHEVIELLAKTARGFHWQTSMDGLLSLCEGHLGMRHEIEDAARQIVEIADSRGAAGYTESLTRILVEPTEKPWRQVPIARALLRAANETSAQVALNFITRTMEDDASEVWIKSAAMDALAEGLGGQREAEVAAFILEAWVDPLTSPTSRFELGREVLRVAHKYESDVIAILLVVVSGLCKYDAELTSSCAGLFARWGHQMGLSRAVAHLWSLAKSPRIDCYPRIRALEGIVAHGRPDDRAAAIATLLESSGPPMSDGRKEWLALDALLRAGEPYPGRIRERLQALVEGTTVEPNWIVRGCELALDFGDRELVESVTKKLLLIWAGKKPNEFSKDPDGSNRKSVGKLLRGTEHWPDLEASALAVLRSPHRESRENWGAVETVAFSAAGSTVLKLIEDLLAVGKPSFRPWHILLRELDQRGWRVQIHRDRRLTVLRSGQEEPRPDADLGW
jgi:TIR domain